MRVSIGLSIILKYTFKFQSYEKLFWCEIHDLEEAIILQKKLINQVVINY